MKLIMVRVMNKPNRTIMRSKTTESITLIDIKDLNETGQVRSGNKTCVATEGNGGDDVGEGGDGGGLGEGLGAEDGEGG